MSTIILYQGLESKNYEKPQANIAQATVNDR